MHTSLRQRRRALRFTQEEVARALGITRTAYNKLEHGHTRITLDAARQLAHLLKVPVDSLFPLEENGLADTAKAHPAQTLKEGSHVTREHHLV